MVGLGGAVGVRRVAAGWRAAAAAVRSWRMAPGWCPAVGTRATGLALAAALACMAACADGDVPSGAADASSGRTATAGPVSTLTRNQALHIPMRDGVRIAVDVWLPDGTEDGALLPTMIRATRYWRARGFVDSPLDGDSNFDEAERWNAAGYALVLVDGRGSGASFGIRRFELAEDEVRDYGEVADWIVSQPWSNGRVGAYGVSYAGNTAEMLAVNRHPAVKSVAPLFNDFDNFGHLVFPGGVLVPRRGRYAHPRVTRRRGRRGRLHGRLHGDHRHAEPLVHQRRGR